MRNISIIFVALVLVVCFVLNPFTIDAHDGYLHAKGEMITVYDSNTSWAFSPQMSDDKLFFMTAMIKNVENGFQQCYVFDAESKEYTIIKNAIPNIGFS